MTTVQTQSKLDKKAFYDWLDRQEGRYELEYGKAVPRERSSRGHWLVATNFVFALSTKLPESKWNAFPVSLPVETGDHVRFPEVLVEQAGGDPNGVASAEPTCLVEVLSPSSVGRDFNLKFSEYTTLDSVEAYLIASQDEPICWLWPRLTDVSRTFPKHPVEIKGLDQAVDLPCLGIVLPLKDVYRGVFS